MSDTPILKSLRSDKASNAIVFVHGFGGDTTITWGRFPEFLMATPVLDGWDMYSLGYLSKLAPDFKGVWSGNPSINTIASYLYTHAYVGKLEQYDAIVFIAHSMGGLVVQRALLDNPLLLSRTSHVFLFGTPSNGLPKAGWFRWFKRQIDDMAAGGPFISTLRSDWSTSWPKAPPPGFWAIAGDADEFVPASSSLSPFTQDQRLVVPGNHLEIVKPNSADDLAVQAVVKGIQGEAAPGGPWNAARVALQMLEFREAIDTLEAHFEELDDAHRIELALALEGLGEFDKALEVLEKADKRGTDAQGVLAGRLKRRWIAEGRQVDYERSMQHYKAAYNESVAQGNHAQAFYHGINITFLLAARDGNQDDITEMARNVLSHCEQAEQNFWCLGTQGEAELYLGNHDKATEFYEKAVNMTPAPEPWMLKSMHSQASQLAAILNQDLLIADLDRIFRQEHDSF